MQIPPFLFERPACTACDGAMQLARREPHPTLGRGWERLTFECPKCGHVQTRAEDVPFEEKPPQTSPQAKSV